MNILLVTMENPFVTKVVSGGQVRSKIMWDAIRAVNPTGYNYLLTSPNEYALDENECVRFFEAGTVDYWTISGLFKKFYKTLAGLGFLPESLVREFNPQYYFPDVKFDYIVLRFQRAACLFPFHKLAPIILDYDDHPLQSFDSAIRHLLPLPVQPLAWIFNRFQFYVVRSRIRGGFLANYEQAEGFGHNVTYLPNAVPFPGKTYNASEKKRDFLLTVGAISYPPNSRGIDKFIKEIWPEFHRKFPDIKYVIAGKGASKSCSNQWNKTEGVEYVGYVDNLDKVYENSIAAVIPIFEGSGTAIKTRESMIHSRCCLSTPFGARGLESDSEIYDRGLFVFNNAEEFVRAYEKISKESSRTLFEDNIFSYASKNFSPVDFEAKLKEMLIG